MVLIKFLDIDKIVRKSSSEKKLRPKLIREISSLRERASALEHKTYQSSSKYAAVASIITFVGSILFLSANITGNAVNNTNQTTSNWIGIILFIMGIATALIYFNKR